MINVFPLLISDRFFSPSDLICVRSENVPITPTHTVHILFEIILFSSFLHSRHMYQKKNAKPSTYSTYFSFLSLSLSLSTNCPSSMAHICTYIFFSRLIFVETRTVFFLVSFDREYCDRSQRVIKRVVQERRQRRLKNLLFAVR